VCYFMENLRFLPILDEISLVSVLDGIPSKQILKSTHRPRSYIQISSETWEPSMGLQKKRCYLAPSSWSISWRTRESHSSFNSTPAWPFTHNQDIPTCWVRLSSSIQSSRFFTGSLEAVRQPLRFQLCIHTVIPFFTYWESVCILIAGRGAGSDSTYLMALITADNSIRLLVVC